MQSKFKVKQGGELISLQVKPLTKVEYGKLRPALKNEY